MFPSIDGELRIQYHSYKSLPSQHQNARFLSSEHQSSLRHDKFVQVWALHYVSLKAYEANKLRSFYESMPALQSFEFTDPWKDQLYLKVTISSDGIHILQTGPASYDVDIQLEALE